MAKKLKAYKDFQNEELYKAKSINDLILLSIYLIDLKKEKCTFEKLVNECFTLFPRELSFSSLKQWPDSRKLDRPLRDMRRKFLISGNPQSFFTLTKSGKKYAEEIALSFKQKRILFS